MHSILECFLQISTPRAAFLPNDNHGTTLDTSRVAAGTGRPQPNPGQYGKDSRIVSWIRSPTLRSLKESGWTNLRRGRAGGDGK